MSFKNTCVLITGSSRGIGHALATRLIAEGARVAINGRDSERVAAVCASLGAGSVAAPGDLTSAAGCEQVVTAAVAALGGLDLLVNNAGVFPIASIADTDEGMWDGTFAANVKAAFFTSRAALPALRERRGAIINHASIAGLVGLANVSAYCASKGALVQLTRSMAIELAPDIRVNCVCPTTVDNEMGWTAFNRTGDPQAAHAAFVAGSRMRRMAGEEDIIEAMLYLASARAAFVTGIALPVDGGRSAGV